MTVHVKKRVAGSPSHPGYYWLAYTWENLYLSCQFCNQRRYDKPTTDEQLPGPAKGKLDQFPLIDESTRVFVPGGNIAQETRLLIDPCADYPEEHLSVALKGDLISIDDSQMGTTTIDI